MDALPLGAWGKHWGLRRLADAGGFFSMVAIDQRPPIVQLVARARGVAASAAHFADIVQAKALLAEGLAGHASALLVDPDFGLPAATPHLDASRGLLVALEEHGHDESAPGRRSQCIPQWSVAQIRRLGADAVKLRAWYRPDAPAEQREHQQALVRAFGADCRAADIAFVFELLAHAPAHEGGGAAVNAEDPAQRRALMLESVRVFTDPAFGVDLLGLESPLPMAALAEPDGKEADRVQREFDALAAACAGVPWVLRSAAASSERFERALVHACRAGGSGFLAGRSLWWEALHAFPDAKRVRSRLQHHTVPRLQHLRHVVQRHAKPLRPAVDFSGVQAEGDLCAARERGSAA